MTSELNEHSYGNSLFLKKRGYWNAACTHCTLDSGFKITQRDFINCTEILRLIFVNEIWTRD